MSIELLFGLIGVVTAVVTIGGNVLVQRRYQKQGGGEAQIKLNLVQKELSDAFEAQNKVLADQLAALIIEVATLKGAIGRISTERTDLKQELTDVHGSLTEARKVVATLTTEIVGLRAELKASREETVVAEKRADVAEEKAP